LTLTDGFNRRVTYLRLSVTDRCNYRCVYCMPEHGITYVPHRELLTFEEIEQVVAALVQAGIRRVRVTGGEPLVRRDLPVLVERLAALAGIDEVVLTTNAHLLEVYAEELAAAGLAAINISLDSLRRERFARITRGGDVERVLRGVEAARRAGIPRVKLNAVVIRGFNEDEIEDLVRFSVEHDAVARFIEFMPIGEDTIWGRPNAVVPAAEMREALGRRWDLVAEGTKPGKGPAKYYRLFGEGMPSWGHPVGIIAAVTECFCADCNRIRLTAQGGLRACLADDREVNLRDILRAGGSQQDLIAAAQAALSGKLESHAFRLDGDNVTIKQMVSIGG
jgi:cyclic pyranopterin phosphate synthase